MDPNFPYPHEFLGCAYEQKGRHDDAIAEFNRALTLSGGKPVYVAYLGHSYARLGRRDEAQRRLDELTARVGQRGISPYFIAIIYLGLGEKNRALEWLEKAYADRSGSLLQLKVDPIFDSLRAEPRFDELVRKVGLQR